jgi:Oxidoreductase molybdopterin binding domain
MIPGTVPQRLCRAGNPDDNLDHIAHGWTQHDLAGAPAPASVLVNSLERNGAFNRVVLSAGQITDPDSLLALRVNGADLPLNHGYPARVIVPASPGVHNTKWVASMTFAS